MKGKSRMKEIGLSSFRRRISRIKKENVLVSKDTVAQYKVHRAKLNQS